MTPQQLVALDFIRARIAHTGLAPTLSELAEHCSLKAKSGAHRLIEALIHEGAVIRVSHRARGIRLVDQPTLSAVPTAALLAELARRSTCADGATNPERRH